MQKINTTGYGLLKALLRPAVDFILPPRCVLCHGRLPQADKLCGACFRALYLISEPSCACCHWPFDVPMPDGSLCGACLQSPPIFKKAVTPALYAGAGRELVLKLKHGKQLELVALMADLMGQALKQRLPDVCFTEVIFTPVPLHWTRLFSRRHNQSALLARAVAKAVGGQYHPSLIQRIRATPTQGGLKRKARERNVQGAFKVPKKYVSLTNKSKQVVVVDDVFTTGATVKSVMKALKKAHFSTLYSLSFARVVNTMAPREA